MSGSVETDLKSLSHIWLGHKGAEIPEPFRAGMVDGMRSPLVSGMVGGIMPEV